MEAVKQKTAQLLKALTKEDFQHCFDQWEKREARQLQGQSVGGRVAAGSWIRAEIVTILPAGLLCFV
ncbi:hypothetical protein TNCV_2437651 [Trichonephila clavipes]|nr:hypothetical protein TNCV_2437651 [Trichonephila clavipes]